MNNSDLTITRDNDGRSTWQFLIGELKPKGKWLTPFNIISIPIMILGLVLIVIRFWKGSGINYQSYPGSSMGSLDRI